MNTIKFTNYNSLNIPQTIILKTNNNIEILEKVNNTMYYDKSDKQYRTWPSFITTKYGTYA